MNISEAPEILTVAEAAQVLRIGRNQAYELIRQGELPALRLGRTIRVSKAALERLLDPDPGDSMNVTPHHLRAI